MRLLETHGCQGCGTEGYLAAGWEVDVVEIDKRHAKYNPADRFILADAVTYIRDHGREYDAIHASPPCQWYTRGNAARRGQDSRWHRSIPEIREALESTGRPYVLENVKDAAWDMKAPISLCGCMFDLTAIDTDGVTLHLRRERLFETNWGLTSPRACHHPAGQQIAGAYGGARRDKHEARNVRKGGYVPANKDVVKTLLGVTHDVTWNGLFEGLPPAYTRYIGLRLAEVVDFF